MSEPRVCTPWNPESCEGTPTCPPRCPRFVTAEGAPVLVEPLDCPAEEYADGLSPPEADLVGPDDLLLSATVDGQVVGHAWLRPAEDGGRRVRLDVAPAFEDGDLPAELARQAVAYAIADGGGKLRVDTGVAAFERAGFDLSAAGDGSQSLALTDPAARAVTTPPADRAGGENQPVGTGSATPGDPGAITALPSPTAGRDLSGLFAPEGVAVVGATEREGAIGRLLLENLDDYRGAVVPVTPRADEVFGRQAVDSLADIENIDLAVVALPPADALSAIETAGEQGIENVVVVSAGFEEAGDDGTENARRLEALADRYEMNVVGPNAMGVMSTASGLNASFGPRNPASGSVSLISQSGAFITASLTEASQRGLGFRHVVSVGNKTDLDAVDYLAYLDRDPETAVIAAYLEDIDRGVRFVEVAREVTRSTPVVVLKPGRTDAGASAAASHTGSLASDDTAVEAAFERAGVVRAASTQELYDYAAALRGPLPDGESVGIVTNAGGPGVLATDATADGCTLADLTDETREHLADLLPPTASVDNPTDVLGDADADRFGQAIDAMLADDTVDVGMVVTTPHPLVEYDDLIAEIGRLSRVHETPVVTCLMDGEMGADATRTLRRYGISNYPDPSRAADAIAALGQYATVRDRNAVTPGEDTIDRDAVRKIVDHARSDGRDQLGVAAMDLLAACGIDVPGWQLAATPAEAATVADRFDSRVVLKIASPDIPHKVDVGGVRLGVDPGDVETACRDLLDAVTTARPDATIDGVVVQQAVDTETAVETVVGVTDSQFGPLVTFGLGGVLVEHVEDVAFRRAPLDEQTALTLLDDIEASSVLDGARGKAGVDREALVDALVTVSTLVATCPSLSTLELNPLFAGPDGVQAVDLHAELSDRH